MGSRLALLAAIATTAWMHWVLAWRAPFRDIVAGGAKGFLGSALVDYPAVTLSLAAQAGVILLAYGVFFFLIAWLARPRSNEPPRLRSPTVLVIITWLAGMWLLLHFHNRAFRNSAWVGVLDPDAGSIAMMAMDALAIAWLAWRGVRAMGNRTTRWIVAATLAATVTAVTLLVSGWPGKRDSVGTEKASARRPDVILIGLDSLRRDLVVSATPQTLPAISALRDRSFLQSGLVSSLARTYPSWVSLLSGRPVRETGARENHSPLSGVDTQASLAWTLRKAGYRTIFATDDTQFSFIGKEFGFDEILAPQPGVPNFALTRFGDVPMANLLVQLPGSERLLPALAANRAFSHAYRHERFVRRLRDGLGRSDDRPVLLAIHLCAIHWPFYFADPRDGSTYDGAAKVLDRQLGAILEMLPTVGRDPSEGVLMVFADHGDSAGESGAKPIAVQHMTDVDLGKPVPGHGASLLDPLQWRSFALFSGAGAHGSIAPGRSEQLAGLDDLAPTLLALAGSPLTDRPVLDVAATASGASRVTRAVVPMETGLRSGGLDLANPDPKVVSSMANTLYRILPDGATELTQSAYEEAIGGKDLGVTNDRFSLVSLWQPDGFVIVSEDLQTLRLDVYPGQRPEDVSIPAMLDDACREPEIRARHSSWCSALRGPGDAVPADSIRRE